MPLEWTVKNDHRLLVRERSFQLDPGLEIITAPYTAEKQEMFLHEPARRIARDRYGAGAFTLIRREDLYVVLRGKSIQTAEEIGSIPCDSVSIPLFDHFLRFEYEKAGVADPLHLNALFRFVEDVKAPGMGVRFRYDPFFQWQPYGVEISFTTGHVVDIE